MPDFDNSCAFVHLNSSMKTVLEQYLRSHTNITDADIDRICSLAKAIKLRKHEFLLQVGEVCRHKSFIGSGLLKTFSVKEDGSEHIIQFSTEQTWALEAESYHNEKPSRYAIDVIEDTELLQWSKDDFEGLRLEIPGLQVYSEQIISRTIHQTRHRLVTALGGTPEEKYDDFVRNFPALLSRLPLRMIAAYLGISLKTLTRLRSAQLQRS